MRYINPSMHAMICEKLKTVPVRSDLINGRVISATDMEKKLSRSREMLEQLYNTYQQKIKELQDISDEYLVLQNEARVHLRRQQVKALSNKKNQH